MQARDWFRAGVPGAPVPRRHFKESRSTILTDGGNRGTPIDRAPHVDLELPLRESSQSSTAPGAAGTDFPATTSRISKAPAPPARPGVARPSATAGGHDLSMFATVPALPLSAPANPHYRTSSSGGRPGAGASRSSLHIHHGPCTGRSILHRGLPLPGFLNDLKVIGTTLPGGLVRSIRHLNPIIPMNARRFLPFGLLARLASLLVLLFWAAHSVHAGRPQPENIIFGAVWSGGRPLTATNLVIEARRGDVGPVVARYRLGEDPGAGELFFLRIQRESAPALSPVSVDANEPLTLVVNINGKPCHVSRVHLPSPGRCVRVDFGRGGDTAMITAVNSLPAGIPMPRPVPAAPPVPSPTGKGTDGRLASQFVAAVLPWLGRRNAL